MSVSKIVKSLMLLIIGILAGIVLGLFNKVGEQKETSQMYTVVTNAGMSSRTTLDIPVFVGSYRTNLNNGKPLSEQLVTEENTFVESENKLRYEGVYTLTKDALEGIYLIPKNWENGGKVELTENLKISSNAKEELVKLQDQLNSSLAKGSVWIVSELYLNKDDELVGIHYEWKGNGTLGNVLIYNKN
jgi:hypothetical protein